VPFWPFKRKKQEEESYFASTGGAQVAPSSPPVIPESGALSPQHTLEATAPPPAASQPGTPTTVGGLPPEVLQQLASAGIHLDANTKVQVATQTTQLHGDQAMQFLGQLSSILGSAGWKSTSFQLHPQINLMTEGRMQESPDQLKANGLDAKATVKDLEEKLAMDGGTHLVKLKLTIEREGAEPYETTTAAMVPANVTEQFAEGKTFPAKVDPNDKNQVLVLFPDA
jgi:hypothetical protein